jgi:hypothetical protein
VNAFYGCPGRKYHRRGNDGTGQRADTDFIDSGDPGDSGLPQNTLKMKHRFEASILTTLLFRSPQKDLIKFPCTRPGISPQPAKELRRNDDVRLRISFLNVLYR